MLPLAVLAGLAGCRDAAGTDDASSRLSPDDFMTVLVEIREAEREVEADGDSAQSRFEARKAEILERHGTTEEELRGFVRRRGEDVEYLSELWDTLNQRLRYVPPRHDPASGSDVPLIEDSSQAGDAGRPGTEVAP
jgi:hypothetical protein